MWEARFVFNLVQLFIRSAKALLW